MKSAGSSFDKHRDGPPTVAVLIFEVLLNGTALFNHTTIDLPRGLNGLRMAYGTVKRTKEPQSDSRRAEPSQRCKQAGATCDDTGLRGRFRRTSRAPRQWPARARSG